ncbi:hypothetical protein [Streptomyces sp. enrichment culture]|uniref:hypothetical protein n=1 Tax=Streptomyces sp. enrichment culture TaxID=1795815 RepID=UPI003F572D6C
MTVDDQIAALLQEGVTYARITEQLRVSSHRIGRVRLERGILLAAGRAKRSRAEIDALEPTVIRMLLTGASVHEIRREARYSLNEIARLRRDLKLPVPPRVPTHLTVDEALARYTMPATSGGHWLWRGPMRGRAMTLHAENRRFNVRHVLFERARKRQPIGYVVSSCGLIPCIAGSHLTDAVIRGTAPASGGRR